MDLDVVLGVRVVEGGLEVAAVPRQLPDRPDQVRLAVGGDGLVAGVGGRLQGASRGERESIAVISWENVSRTDAQGPCHTYSDGRRA